MATTILSTKGQVILPKTIREAHHWEAGLQFSIEDTSDGILLRPLKPFKQTHWDDVYGCVNYTGETISIEEMNNAIRQEAKKHK